MKEVCAKTEKTCLKEETICSEWREDQNNKGEQVCVTYTKNCISEVLACTQWQLVCEGNKITTCAQFTYEDDPNACEETVFGCSQLQLVEDKACLEECKYRKEVYDSFSQV